MNFQTFSQVAFAFAVTPSLLAQGLTYALVMGLIGGLFRPFARHAFRSHQRCASSENPEPLNPEPLNPA